MANIVADKSLAFGVRIVSLSNYLREAGQYELANQIIRSGTSIGANIAEAQYAQSSKDFTLKMHIALKEANETRYWLRLLRASKLMDDKLYLSFMKDVEELIKLLTSIINSKKQKMKKQ